MVGEEDFFGNLVLYCIEEDRAASCKNFYSRVLQIVEAALFKQRQEAKNFIIHTAICFWTNAMEKAREHLGNGWIFPKKTITMINRQARWGLPVCLCAQRAHVSKGESP